MREKKKARGKYRQSGEKEVRKCGGKMLNHSAPMSHSFGVSHSVTRAKIPELSWSMTHMRGGLDGVFLCPEHSGVALVNCRSLGQSWWKRQWHPTPVLLPGKSHGWRSLVGCSPWGHTESDMTEVT